MFKRIIKLVMQSGKRGTSKEKSKAKGYKLKHTSPLKAGLQQNLQDLQQFVGLSQDIVFRELQIPLGKGVAAAVIYIDGLVDKELINQAVIRALIVDTHLTGIGAEKSSAKLLLALQEKVLTNAEVKRAGEWETVLDLLFSGDTVLLVDGLQMALIIGTRKWADRGVQEPAIEQSIRGPRDSFSETLRINTMLLRRKIKSPKLQFEAMRIGTLSKTQLVVVYIKGVVNPKLVEEVRARLNRIETDGIVAAGMLEEFIEDNTWAVFPQIHHTERPDKAAAHLMEGGVAIITDGTPVVLLLPVTFWQFLHAPEDYYERAYNNFTVRGLRLIAFITALTLPSFYIAVVSFHHEMIPTAILETIISSRRGVPFPALVEALLMEFVLEVIREAAVRLPRNVGQSVSIVGALVLGQAAIQAKLAGPVMVVVVALTAIANFTIPAFSTALAVRFLRFGLMLLSGTLGMFGFVCGIFLLLVHMAAQRSFGVPFLAPAAPAMPSDFKDSQIRLPAWMLSRRPRLFGAKDLVRQKANLQPGPQQRDGKPKEGEKDA